MPNTAVHEVPVAAADTQAFRHTLTGRIVLGLAATVLVALSAQIAIPLPWTPVPLTLQPLAVLCVGLALGPVDAFFAMLAYLAEGTMGLPVFAPSLLTGPAHLLGPTGGFLMAYPVVAALAGGIARMAQRRLSAFPAALIGSSIAVVVLFAAGAAWLASITHLASHAVWMSAVAPFLPGEAIKIIIAAGLYRALHRFAR